jgi:glucose-6-phosphate 1-dehydrogenase
MNKEIPTIFVVLGATGDLVKKKIAPALYNLFEKDNLPKQFRVVGFARRDLGDQGFKDSVREILVARDSNTNTEKLEAFLNLFSYTDGFFDAIEGYHKLQTHLKEIDDQWGVCTNKLFYLAVPPTSYEPILNNLAASGLTKPCSDQEGWTRVIIEKPFGNDLNTARNLDKTLAKFFKEIQIYRLDHYLGKEALQDILAFRFLNNLFEHNWNNTFIEKIEIKLWEKIGVENRGNFYDTVGAFKDVGQNHLLQMLALVTMDRVESLTTESIRTAREQVLEQLIPLTLGDIKKYTFRAQYDGYKTIAGVASDTTIETYFKVTAFLASPRWTGVPIVMEGGKRLKEQRKEIVVHLKHPSPCLCPPDAKEHYQNKITFSLEPKEGVSFDLLRKKPGLKFEIEKKESHFPLRENRAAGQYTEEYEKLLYDCILGDQSLFVSSKEIEAMWRYTDPIVKAWEKGSVPLASYQPDTNEAVVASEYINNSFTAPNISIKKEIGVIGLGKMGGNIARQLSKKGWQVYGYNRTNEVTDAMAVEGIKPTHSVKELIERLESPRVVWLMVPAGKPVDDMLFGKEGIAKLLKKGDIVIDGGNSFYKDSIVRGKKLAKMGIHFMDSGTSGGPKGALLGACLMVGGQKEDFEKYEPLFKDLALDGSYQFFEGYGAGHFTKMIHNGIEYGMMQAIAEGFAVLKKSKYKLDVTRVADIYNHGSVIESRLTDWLHNAFVVYGENLKGVSGSVGHTGEGAWTVLAAKELGVQAKIIQGALEFRIKSEKNPSYAGQVLTALRNQFGGHALGSAKRK